MICTISNEKQAERLTVRFGETASHSAETKVEIKNIPPKFFANTIVINGLTKLTINH